MLDTLAWFSSWKELHDERVEEEAATEYNFFAAETSFCIKSLLLSHVAVIQFYCIERGNSVNPRTLNTDAVEWHFADSRQMAGGSTNKLTAAGFNRADKKASTSNAARMSLVGNNASGESLFKRRKRV